tara:strand:- start:191 stop:502 length:312 start_codon:yes stop_codon:yes gene_type:complete
MILIKNKETLALIGKGNITEENNLVVKIDSNSREYIKSKVIIEYVIMVLMICISLQSCTVNKNLSKKEKLKIKKTDSILKSQMLQREIDFKEEFRNIKDFTSL